MDNHNNNDTPRIEWHADEGSVKFEGQDVLFLWIETAMKSFVETIEEVSGNQGTEIVMETAGYRMGLIVSDFFQLGNPENVIQTLPSVYESAGWGLVEIKEVDEETKTAVIRVKNSWEYRINRLQEKKKTGGFFPGHFAGNLAGLFGTYIDYKVVKSQLGGDAYDEFHYFPSEKSPIENLREFVKSREQEEIERLETKVDERTKELSNLVKEISSPIIPVLDHIVVMPMLGKYDEVRAEDMMTQTISELPDYEANYLILDLTGIDQNIGEYTISLIHNLTNAASLLGTKSILVGIAPKLGVKITNSGFDLSGIDCFSTLQHAIHFALAQEGKQVIG